MTEPIGTIRIALVGAGPKGPFFDFPYYEETMFTRQVTAIRADGFFNSGSVFIPYHNIGYIMKVPNSIIEEQAAMEEARFEVHQ